MDYFPAFMNIRGRKAVVIGGGAVAARKAAMLARAGARVTIVAPRVSDALAGEIALGTYAHHAEIFADPHLTGAVLAVAATNDRATNQQVARHGRLRGVPVNVVDDAELSSFIMPAIIDRAPVTIAISTGGASPVLARWARARIELALPVSLGRIARLAGRMRRTVAARLPDIGMRRRFWERSLDGPALDLALAGREDDAAATLSRALSDAGREDGQVWLVGAAPGDPELLTIKALRALQSADVILHDRRVPDGVLELARRDADRVLVDEGRDIGDLLIGLARDGKRVVRFGDRVEMQALTQAGIICHLIPGVAADADIQQPTQFITTENAA